MDSYNKDITLRRAELADKKQVFTWRNHETIRKFATNPAIISWKTHSAWFDDILLSKDSFLLIGEINHKPLGVIRFDVKNEHAEVSVYLVPEFQGKGLGSSLIYKGNEWLKLQRPLIKKVNATILSENETSISAFDKAGFKIISYEMEHKL